MTSASIAALALPLPAVAYYSTSYSLDRVSDDRAMDAAPEERTYSGDLVLLVLFIVLAMVVGGLFLLHAQVG